MSLDFQGFESLRRTNDKARSVIGAVLLLATVATTVSFAQQSARIDSVDPSQAAPGKIVTITGSGFGGKNARITIGAVAAEVVSATGSRVSFVVPSGAACGPTFVNVTNPGGQTGRIAFSVVCAPVNTAPVVNAGPDLTVIASKPAILKGSVSDDGRPASPPSVRWKKVKGPGTVTLTNDTSADTSASFSAPGEYVLQLTASDSELTASDEATVYVTPSNSAPTANAGNDYVARVTETVRLSGNASIDPDGDALTYSWRLVSVPAGSSATLAGPMTATPTFVIDRPGTYVASLVVDDGALASDPDTVTVTTENTPPVANAGPDQTAPVATTITLDATGSSDVDGDALTYQWAIKSAPLGSGVALSDPSAVQPTFVIDQPGSYVLQLVVKDGAAVSEPDTVVVSTVNSAPVANAGADQTAFVTQTVTLHGEHSSDVDGDALTFAWTIVSAPSGTSAVLTNPTSVTPSFVVDRPGTYVVRLTVNDGTVTGAPDTVTITTANSAPVANAGADQSTLVNQTVALDGSGSTDVDRDPLTYAWSLVSVPAGSSASLSDPTAVAPTFVADRPGTYVAQLVVSEPNAVSAPDTVTITTLNSAPVANAGLDLTVVAGQMALLSGAASSDVDGDPLAFQWSFTSVPAGSSAVLANSTSAGPSFIVDRPGTFVVQLIVNDGTVNSAPDTVVINTANSAPVANAGADQLNARVGTSVMLDGSSSSDADGHTLAYAWSLSAKPAGSAAVLSDPTAIGPSFTADVAGDYVAQLVVNDGFSNSTPDTVLIRAADPLPNMTLSLVGSPVVAVGQDVQLQIRLARAAPSSGTIVTIASDDPTRLTVGSPATAAIAPGGTVGLVTLRGVSSGVVTVRGTALGFADGMLDVVVSNNTIAVPATLNAPLGQVTDFPISITRDPGNNGPVAVSIASDNPAAVLVNTPTVTVPAGSLSANAIIFGQGAGGATLTATAANFASDTSAVTTTAHLEMRNVGATATMTSGFGFPITIQLESPPGSPVAAPAGGIAVAIAAGNPGCVAVPASSVVAQGTTTTIASITYGGTAPLPCTSTVTVTGPTGVTADSVTVTVNPAPPITLAASTVGGGLQTGNVNGLLGDASHGGVTVHLVSSDPTRVLLAPDAVSVGAASIDIPVANGVSAFSYYVQGTDWIDGVTSAAAVTVTASATGFSDGNGTINYVRPVLDIMNLGPSTTSLSANIDFVVRVGVPSPVNTMQMLQARRFGAPALIVTVSSSNPAVAEIDHNGGVGGQQTQTSTIAAGLFTTPNDTTGAFELDPRDVGSTTVTASIPGFTTLAFGTLTVAVSGPAITMPGTFSLGGGLQHGVLQGTLGASQHGGVTVHIASSDPARVKIAADANSAGADAIDVPVANGATGFTFYVQGADWVPGASTASPVTITASAVAFSSGTVTMNYVQPVLDMLNLSASTTSLSASSDFIVRVGVPTVTGSQMQILQARRFGAPALLVTASNSNAAVAEIDHNGGVDGAQAQTSTIAAGQSITPNNATGGFEFDPLGGGTTVVTASIPGFITLPAGVQSVTVTGAGISMPTGLIIGGGLQAGSFLGFLGASNHGSVIVHLQSSDPARVLLAPNGTSPGAAAIDIAVANGANTFAFFLQGSDWVEGVSSAQPVIVTATATGFTSGSSTASYVRPVLDIINLPSATTTLSASADFVVRIGVPGATNTMQMLQARRFGASPLVVTATNSSAGIAEIDQDGGLNGAQSQTASIAAGQSATPNGAAGGFEFDPFGTGGTVVQASIPNFLSLPAATVSVTVSSPAITLPALEAIGGGLMYGAYSGTLGGSQHGGVQVRLVSSDPSRVLLAATSTSAGAAEIDIPVANGATAFNFWVVGTDWVDGASTSATVTVTATASGFTSAGTPVSYVRPALDIVNVTATASVTSANRDFNVRVGIPNATNTGLRLLQWRRPGASDLVVTVANSNAAVAEIDQNGGLSGAQSQTARIVAGQSSTPFNATGGLEFDPLATGSTVLTATIPGFSMVPAAGFAVNVTP